MTSDSFVRQEIARINARSVPSEFELMVVEDIKNETKGSDYISYGDRIKGFWEQKLS